jgi:hypothetical protein
VWPGERAYLVVSCCIVPPGCERPAAGTGRRGAPRRYCELPEHKRADRLPVGAGAVRPPARATPWSSGPAGDRLSASRDAAHGSLPPEERSIRACRFNRSELAASIAASSPCVERCQLVVDCGRLSGCGGWAAGSSGLIVSSRVLSAASSRCFVSASSLSSRPGVAARLVALFVLGRAVVRLFVWRRVRGRVGARASRGPRVRARRSAQRAGWGSDHKSAESNAKR